MANMSAQFYEEARNGLVSKCVHKLISIYVYCDLDLWPLTSKINRIHHLNMVTCNMSAKLDEEAHNGLVSIVFTSLFQYMSILTLNFDMRPPKSIELILSLANMSTKFDEDLWMMPLVTIILGLWPPESIEFILLLWLTCMQSFMKVQITVKSLLCSQVYFIICQLWPWPLTSGL